MGLGVEGPGLYEGPPGRRHAEREEEFAEERGGRGRSKEEGPLLFPVPGLCGFRRGQGTVQQVRRWAAGATGCTHPEVV